MLLLTAHAARTLTDSTLLVPATVVATAGLIRRYWGQREPERAAAMRAWPLWRAAVPLAGVVAASALAAEVLAPRLDVDRATLAWFAVIPTAYALAVLGAHFGFPGGEER